MKRVIIMKTYKTSGVHCVFYYCGLEHLIVNIYDYVNKGIEKNELVYLFGESEIIQFILKHVYMHKDRIQTLNIPDLINTYNGEEMMPLAKEILSWEKVAKEKGYSGIRIINQVSYLLNNISNRDFLNFENLLNQLVKESNISVMCAYDFDDYFNEKLVDDDALIEQSFKIHSHRFYNFKIIKNTECV